MSMITENVAQIRSRIAAAARAAGRDPADIRLCAATKMNDSAAVREAIAAGVDCCGENRVQELVKKLDEHAYDGAPVHFIGALQRNKVRQVVGQVDVIESVDRERLCVIILGVFRLKLTLLMAHLHLFLFLRRKSFGRLDCLTGLHQLRIFQPL